MAWLEGLRARGRAALVHGGPYPTASDARGSSVGTLAIARLADGRSTRDALH